MRRVLTVLGAVAFTLAVGLSGDANATILTLSGAQIKLGQGLGPDEWVATNTNPGSTTHSTGSLQFAADFDPSFSGTAEASWTLDLGTFLNPFLGASSGDLFGLIFKNSNANDWDFQVSVATDAGNFDSGFTTLGAGFAASLYATLGVGVTEIEGVTLTVRGDVPRGIFPNNDDWNANFNVNPVPEPGSLILLGTGLSFLGLGRRKRQQ